MITIPDTLDAVVAYLLADTEVSTLASTRIWNAEMPTGEGANMPRYSVLVTWVGGMPQEHLQTPRMDMTCYGATPKQARTMYRAVRQAMLALSRQASGEALLHGANASGGPITGRDPDTHWPFVWLSWNLIVSEQTA